MKIKERNDPPALRTVAGTMVRNTILLRIPQKEFDAIQPHLEPTSLQLGAFVLRQHESVNFVYFLNTGLASLIAETEDGRSVEVGVAGSEVIL